MSEANIIQIRNLTKRYGNLTALNNIDFDIRSGEIFGLLGPNGAGKSTFLSILTTLSTPTEGDIFIKNYSVSKQSGKVKKYIGFVPQDIALYPMLSAMDNLNFWAGIYGLRGPQKKERITEALSIVRLTDRAKDKVENYSGGMKRRLNIAVALLHHPEILVMDEPTVGVDIQSRRYIMDAIKNLRQEGKTIIFTSHYIDEMETLCDRVAVMDRGSIKSVGTVGELQDMFGRDKLEDIMLGLLDG